MNGISTRCPFSEQEKTAHDHINKLELHATLLGLSSLASKGSKKHTMKICVITPKLLLV